MFARRPLALFLGSLLALVASRVLASDDAYLLWTAASAEAVGKGMRAQGRVGGLFDFRIKSTNKSYNFKLRATWLTPEVIRASARLEQLRSRLSDQETKALVSAAEQVDDTVVLVEIDPREGSGVIPNEWTAVLQPGTLVESKRAVKGTLMPALRDLPALRGVTKRDYAYDVFWVAFPLMQHGQPLFTPGDTQAELVVRIEDKEGRVSWPIPSSIRDRTSARSDTVR